MSSFPESAPPPIRLTVGPYGFLWLELQPSPEPVPSSTDAGEPELEISGITDWMSVLEGNGRRELEESVLQRLYGPPALVWRQVTPHHRYQN